MYIFVRVLLNGYACRETKNQPPLRDRPLRVIVADRQTRRATCHVKQQQQQQREHAAKHIACECAPLTAGRRSDGERSALRASNARNNIQFALNKRASACASNYFICTPNPTKIQPPSHHMKYRRGFESVGTYKMRYNNMLNIEKYVYIFAYAFVFTLWFLFVVQCLVTKLHKRTHIVSGWQMKRHTKYKKILTVVLYP